MIFLNTTLTLNIDVFKTKFCILVFVKTCQKEQIYQLQMEHQTVKLEGRNLKFKLVSKIFINLFIFLFFV